MGCWNTTCGISGLPIFCGEEVAVFLLVQNGWDFMKNFVWNRTYFAPCLLPFYGSYNDYGDVEKCYGAGLPILIEALRSKLTEMEEGENECHDIPARRDELSMEKMFELDHEDRLFLDYRNKSLKVVHVQIKKSIFDYIIENWEPGKKLLVEGAERSKEQQRTTKLREALKVVDSINDIFVKDTIAMLDDMDFESAYRMERLDNPLLSATKIARIKNSDVICDLYKGHVIDVFMDAIRKPWIKQIGNGSQDTDPEPYRFLMTAMTKVLDAEQKEWDNENDG